MTTKRHNTEERRRQIIDAARQMIVKHGSEYVTVRRIAKAVGISEGAIYRHFKCKRDILLLLADHIEETLLGDIGTIRTSEGRALERIGDVLRGHISAIEQRHGLSHQVIADIISIGDKKLNTRFYEIVTKYIDSLAELISAGIEAGDVRPDIDPNVAATQLYGMIQGLVNMWTLSNFSFNLVERYIPLWEHFRDSISRQPAATLS